MLYGLSRSIPRSKPDDLRPSAKGSTANERLHVDYRVGKVYYKGSQTWRLIVVRGATDGELLVLARHLHATFPTSSFHVFDSDVGLEAYAAWTLNYPSVTHPMPEAWVSNHHLLTINQMLSRRGVTWEVTGGMAHRTSPMRKLIDLE